MFHLTQEELAENRRAWVRHDAWLRVRGFSLGLAAVCAVIFLAGVAFFALYATALR